MTSRLHTYLQMWLPNQFCNLYSTMGSGKFILKHDVRETSCVLGCGPVFTANCCVYYNATVSKVLQNQLRVEQEYGRIVGVERKQGRIARASTRPRAYKMQAFGPLSFFLQLPQQSSLYSSLSLLTYQSIYHLHIFHHSYFQTSQQTLHNQSCHTTALQTGTPAAPTTTSTWNKDNDTVVPTGNGTHMTVGPSTSPHPESTDTR